MRKYWTLVEEYARQIIRHWLSLATSTFFAVAATTYGLRGGTPLGWSALTVIALLFLIFAGFQAWKEQRDLVDWFTDRNRMSNVLVKVWDDALVLWERGCNTHNKEGAERWCVDYNVWVDQAKKKLAKEVGDAESKVVFIIGDTRKLGLGPGFTTEQETSMAYLGEHLSCLRKAVERYLPSATAYSLPLARPVAH